MRKVFFIIWWAALLSCGYIALARYFQPATFSASVVPFLLGLAFISVIGATYYATYE
ncbi:MAG: hypothetical protein O3A36_03105 [bacterium]|nr:hypothetical protein [bacterium]